MEEVMANKSNGFVTVFKRLLAQSTGRIAITCLKPLQVRLDNTLGMISNDAIFTDVDAMLKAEESGDIPTFAKSHSGLTTNMRARI